MSIEVPVEKLTASGDLTKAGKLQFWSEVDKAIQKFDQDKISLKPRFNPSNNQKSKKATNRADSANADPNAFMKKALKLHIDETRCYKLKTPPPLIKEWWNTPTPTKRGRSYDHMHEDHRRYHKQARSSRSRSKSRSRSRDHWSRRESGTRSRHSSHHHKHHSTHHRRH